MGEKVSKEMMMVVIVAVVAGVALIVLLNGVSMSGDLTGQAFSTIDGSSLVKEKAISNTFKENDVSSADDVLSADSCSCKWVKGVCKCTPSGCGHDTGTTC